jgi:hypothetical protein
MRVNILSTVSAEEFDKNVKGEAPFLREKMMAHEAVRKLMLRNQQQRMKQFQENIPKALAFIKELDREFYDLVTEDDKLRQEYEQDFTKHVELWLKFQETASARAELELKQLIFSGHLELLERQYREEKNKVKRKHIHDSMKMLLTRLFDVKIKIREFEIEELQAELNKLKEQLEHAKNNKTEQIDIFLMKMTVSDEETIFDN